MKSYYNQILSYHEVNNKYLKQNYIFNLIFTVLLHNTHHCYLLKNKIKYKNVLFYYNLIKKHIIQCVI